MENVYKKALSSKPLKIIESQKFCKNFFYYLPSISKLGDTGGLVIRSNKWLAIRFRKKNWVNYDTIKVDSGETKFLYLKL